MSGYISCGYSLSPAEIKRQQEERERRLEEEKCQLLERSIDTLRNRSLPLKSSLIQESRF